MSLTVLEEARKPFPVISLGPGYENSHWKNLETAAVETFLFANDDQGSPWRLSRTHER
jgi:hypothetical protein